MQRGNWVPLDKKLTKLLPHNRPFSEVEAMLSLQVDYDDGKPVTVAGYAALWSWSRKRVSNFLDRIGAGIVYPAETRSKQNQRGQIALQIGNRSGTDREQIRMIDSKWIEGGGSRKGTDKEQIRNRSGSTTTYPDPDPNPEGGEEKPKKSRRKKPATQKKP